MSMQWIMLVLCVHLAKGVDLQCVHSNARIVHFELAVATVDNEHYSINYEREGERGRERGGGGGEEREREKTNSKLYQHFG